MTTKSPTPPVTDAPVLDEAGLEAAARALCDNPDFCVHGNSSISIRPDGSTAHTDECSIRAWQMQLPVVRTAASTYLRATTAGEPGATSQDDWDEAYKEGFNDGFGEARLAAKAKPPVTTPSPDVAEVVERLRDVIVDESSWCRASDCYEAADLIEQLARERDEERARTANMARLHSEAVEDRHALKADLQAAEARADRLAGALKGLITWIEDEVGVDLPFDARTALGTTETQGDG